MGLLVADEKKFDNGLTLSDFVISLKGVLRGVDKINVLNGGVESVVYRVHYTKYYYASESAYTDGSSCLLVESGTLDLTEAQISGDIFATIYDDIASKYQNTSAN